MTSRAPTTATAPIADDDPVPRWAAAALVAVLAAWSAWLRWRVLASSPFPFGVDGYFYPVQLRALLAHGSLAYPASPLAFYLLAPFAAATDPMTGAKLGAAVLGALIAAPAYRVGARLGGCRGAGLLAAALATCSAGSAFMTTEFVKNSIGLTVALAALDAGLAAAAHPTRRRLIVAAAAVIAAALTHKMAAAIAVGALAPAALAEAVHRGALRGRRLIYVVLGGGALLAAVAIAGLAAPQRFLSPADVARVRGAIGGAARWSLPALVGDRVRLTMGYEALIGGVLALAVGALLALRRVRRAMPASADDATPADRARTAAWARRAAMPGSPAERAATGALVALALVIALPWLDVGDGEGLGFRLRVAAFLPMALLAAAAARPLGHVRMRSPLSAALAAALAIALPAPADRTEGRIDTHPALVTGALALVGRLPPDAVLVVPERHIAFLAAWYTGAPVALRPEGVPRERRLRLMPLSFIGPGSALDRALTDARAEPLLAPPIGVHPRYPDGLVLVTEDTWDWALARLPSPDRARAAAWPTL